MMRENEAKMQRSLKVLQTHLSEERARVAELHARLIGRSRSQQDLAADAEAAIALGCPGFSKKGEIVKKPAYEFPTPRVPIGTVAGKCPFDHGAAAAAAKDEFHRLSDDLDVMRDRSGEMENAAATPAPDAEEQPKRDQTKSPAKPTSDGFDATRLRYAEIDRQRSDKVSQLVSKLNSIREEPPMALAALKELAMDSLQEGVTIADFSLPDQPLIYANHGFELITGYSIEETIGHNCRFLQGPDTEPEKLKIIRKSINAGQPCVVELQNYRKNGERFVNSLSLTPIRTAEGKVTHYVGIQSDVTELATVRTAELDALKKATIAEAASDAKSKFLAHMSHEIRTPLNGLIAVGQLLESTNLSRMQRDYVSTMRSSGETLQALISDILDFSRVEADKLTLRREPFHPQAVIATVMKIVGLHSSRLKLNIGYHVEDGVPEVVMGDAMRVQQVLLNTVNNAIKFTAKGDIMLRLRIGRPGEATTAAKKATEEAKRAAEEQLKQGIDDSDREWRDMKTAQGMAEVSKEMATMDWLGEKSDGSATAAIAAEKSEGDNPPGWTLQFDIRDTGIGLNCGDVSRIFNSFQQVDLSPTRKYDGTGLGLAISQRLCEAMGGRMWAESPGLGRGSTFRFDIRCDAVPGEDTGAPGDVGEGVPGGTKTEKAEAEKEAIARRRVRASGADTTEYKTTQRVPAAITFKDASKDSPIHVLLYDSSAMVRQTLRETMSRWGVVVTAVSTGDEVVKALNDGTPASEGAPAGSYAIVVAEKNKEFTGAIRRWASGHDKLVKQDGSGAGNVRERSPGGPWNCPAMILMTWPVEASSSHDVSSWGDIGALKKRNSWDDLVSPSGSDGPDSDREPSMDEEVEDFFSTHDAEIVQKPVQHARLQKLIGTAIENKSSTTGETKHNRRDSGERPTGSAGSRGANSKPTPIPKDLRILLAEDHHINMKVACAVLARCGHKDITLCKDGVEVIENLASLPNGLDSFDLVLMDLHMPRMGGMECTKQIRKLYPDSTVPIVAVTADAVEDSRERCLSNGFSSWISKPFRIEQLEGLLDDVTPGGGGTSRAAGG